MRKTELLTSLVLVFFGFGSIFTQGQSVPSSLIYHQLQQLKETKRVLYVAAHPDDENTKLIAYLGNEEYAQVAYLSLTRGDGGQNLIGKELGIGLGQIRTQELLKARERDGGRQFFTRATDFGFSKNPEETLQNWERDKILSDVVWVIRNFKPDIIITRFNTTPGVTHGHHTTSAILAEEAFEAAADPNAFSEQLNEVSTWQAKRIFWNSYNFGGDFEPEDGKIYHEFETGAYNSILGETYSQMAADSRTMHKSQGFGSTAGIGESVDHIQFIKGESFTDSPFEGVPNRWEELENGNSIEQQLISISEEFDFTNPEKSISNLLKLRKSMREVQDKPSWLIEKIAKLDEVIIQSLGLDLEFNTRSELGYGGQEIDAELVINNPSAIPLNEVNGQVIGVSFLGETDLASDNKPLRIPVSFTLPTEIPLSQPYWLEEPVDGAMYQVSDPLKIGMPFNEPNLTGDLSFSIEDQKFELDLPLMYKYNDQVDGEIKQPFTLVPEVDLELSKNTVFLLSESDPTTEVKVRFRGKILDGGLDFINLPADQYKILSVEDDASQRTRTFEVQFLPNGTGMKEVVAQFTTSSGRKFRQTTNRITYKHIPNLTYFTPAAIKLIQADWAVSGGKIGYIPGAGDDVPAVLTSLGYEVSMIGSNDYSVENLSQYKAVIVGIRAFNTNMDLVANQQGLMGYVRSGGNVIIQYNTSRPLLTNQLGPYPFTLSRDRVAVQNTLVEVDWNHPVVSTPNQMAEEDFEGWVQERGLYFVGERDDRYESPFVMQDPGEDPSSGSMIYTKYGEGSYVYTGISFFRQLPAGVPGAIKLFINLIEQ